MKLLPISSVLLFRDFHNKPINCSPQNLPTTYSTKDELYKIMTDLVKDDVPTQIYKFILEAQRNWLENNGTTSARAKTILNTIFPESTVCKLFKNFLKTFYLFDINFV